VQPADLVAGLAVLVGIVGVVVPLLPGTLLIAVAVVVWAVVVGEPTGWLWAGVALLVLALGAVVKYAVPGRGLQNAGVPNRTLLAGGLGAVAGFFVLPVVGLLVGFVAGVYLSELQRLGHPGAWPATKAALKAVGLSVLIELVAAALAAVAWSVGAVST
jgi:uncharacterized protein YqgC (DUF456 family)